MRALIYTGTLLIAFFTAPSFALSDGYLEAIELAKKQSYAAAATGFKTQQAEFKDNPVYRNRSSVWFALSTLANDANGANDDNAEGNLVQVLCATLTQQEWIQLQTPKIKHRCELDPQPFIGATAQLDMDMTTAAIAALGTVYWRKDEYSSALNLLKFASQRASNIGNHSSNTEFTLQQLSDQQATTPDEVIAKLQMQEVLLGQQLQEEVLSSGNISRESLLDSDTTQNLISTAQAEATATVQGRAQQNMGMVQQIMLTPIVKVTCQNQDVGKDLALKSANKLEEKSKSNPLSAELREKYLIIAEHGINDCSEQALADNWGVQRELTREEQQAAYKATRDADRATIKAQRNKARIAGKEPDYFYRVAKKTMCQNSNALIVTSLSDAEGITRKSLAGFMEAGRGQLFKSSQMADGAVLASLNQYLDHSEILAANTPTFDIANRYRNRFLDTLAHCAEKLDLSANFDQAFSSLLARGKIGGYAGDQVKNILQTKQRLNRNKKSPDSMQNMQDTFDHFGLGEFYTRNNKSEQALPELRIAFSGLTPSMHFAQFPEYAYVPLILSAKTIKSITISLNKTKGDLEEVKTKISELRSRIDTTQQMIAKNLNQTVEGKQEQQLAESKSLINDAINSPQVKDAMAQMQKMMSQMGNKNSDVNPADQINALLSQMQSGNMDGDMMKSLGSMQAQMEAQSPFSQADVFGTELERQYYLHSNHALMLLTLVQLSIDIDNHSEAKKQLSSAQQYISKYDAWISPRVKAYQQYSKARYYQLDNAFEEAGKAYIAAVEAWYFNPHSMLDISWSPLDFNAQIMEQAAEFFIQQNQFDRAFSYAELARDTNWNSERLYGAYSEPQLKQETRKLKEQLGVLKQAAQKTASRNNNLQSFNIAKQQGEEKAQKSHRQEFSDALVLIVEIAPLAQWIDDKQLGEFVTQTIQQANREQALRLHDERMNLVAEQFGESISNQTALSPISLSTALKQREIISRELPADTLLLSIWMGQQSTQIFAVDNQGINASLIPSSALNRAFRQFVRKRQYSPDHGHKIYSQLIEPYVTGKHQRLVVVSNGVLQQLPFAALSTNAEEHEWLGDQYLIRSLPRANQLTLTAPKKAMPAQALVLDGSDVPNQDKLAYAAAEITTIFAHFKGEHVKPAQLKKAHIIPLLKKYPVVHFAGHSALNANIPDYSSMKFYNEDMYLAEIRELSLDNIRLMVLGSCESAATQNSYYGDEFSSLQESLHTAGVDAVVSTLHKVDDEISNVLITRFYELLAKGESKDKALQGAQQAAKQFSANNEGLEDNHNWAAFVLSGNNSPI